MHVVAWEPALVPSFAKTTQKGTSTQVKGTAQQNKKQKQTNKQTNKGRQLIMAW
jgi:hypothetical protein